MATSLYRALECWLQIGNGPARAFSAAGEVKRTKFNALHPRVSFAEARPLLEHACEVLVNQSDPYQVCPARTTQANNTRAIGHILDEKDNGKRAHSCHTCLLCCASQGTHVQHRTALPCDCMMPCKAHT